MNLYDTEGTDEGNGDTEGLVEVDVVWDRLSALRAPLEDSAGAPAWPPGCLVTTARALECTHAQWAPRAQRALRFDNHIKVPATSAGVREKEPYWQALTRRNWDH